jgi:hypothetical protein
MGTAVMELAVSSEMLDGEAVLIGKEESFKQGNVWDELAHRLRLAGHDAEAVCEGGEELDLSRYLSEDTLKYLDSIKLDDSWAANDE